MAIHPGAGTSDQSNSPPRPTLVACSGITRLDGALFPSSCGREDKLGCGPILCAPACPMFTLFCRRSHTKNLYFGGAQVFQMEARSGVFS
jgi:hypothetical protein